MKFKIVNPEENKYDNAKENIFIAFDENEAYLGFAYVYPRIHLHQTRKTPYLLYISISTENKELKKILFDKVIDRAKSIRTLYPHLASWVYTGFEYDRQEEKFYLENGFKRQYSVIMEYKFTNQFKYDTSNNLKPIVLDIETNEAFSDYKTIYDENFITPLDSAIYEELKNKQNFKNVVFYLDDKFIGGYLVYQEDDCGYIETIFVNAQYRNMGFGKEILIDALNYFKSIQLKKSQLEVWELNEDALMFYQYFGYEKVRNNMMFPGTDL